MSEDRLEINGHAVVSATRGTVLCCDYESATKVVKAFDALDKWKASSRPVVIADEGGRWCSNLLSRATDRSGQTKKMSFTETCLNTAAGFMIAICAQILIYPLFDIHVPVHTNFAICAIFTAISIVRSYFFRRLFNKLHERGISL